MLGARSLPIPFSGVDETIHGLHLSLKSFEGTSTSEREARWESMRSLVAQREISALEYANESTVRAIGSATVLAFTSLDG